MNQKVLGRKYYKGRLWKITTFVSHLSAGSIYSNSNNRFSKIYERRTNIGEPWQVVRGSAFTGHSV